MRGAIAVSILILVAATRINGQLSLIETAHPADIQYTDQQNRLEQAYQELRTNPASITPVLYRYRIDNAKTPIQIAAMFSLPYESIVTLNNLYNNSTIEANSELIIPSAPGIYINVKPQNDFEELLHILRIDSPNSTDQQEVTIATAQETFRYYFLPGAQFSAIERSAFFNRLFHVPIRSGRVTSLFGPRLDPITNIAGFHNGIDIAAPISTPVRAAQEGHVIVTEIDDLIYGNFITIAHEGSFTTTYAHLQSVDVEVGDRVTISSKIGTVGNTGHSTGPHIHFEIALHSKAVNPLSYMYIPSNYLISNAEEFKRIE